MNSPMHADKLLIGGRILTSDPATPYAEVLAVTGDRISAVGSRDDLGNLIGTHTEVIKIDGCLVLPGFHECHGHLLALGLAGMRLELAGINSEEGVAQLVREQAGRLQGGQWIEGRGWDQHLFSPPHFPTRSVLDVAAPDNPVRLGRVDGHAIWVNSRALQLAGINAGTKDPPAGRIVRDAGGEPTGILINRAMDLIDSILPPPSRQLRETAILQAVDRCRCAGITTFHDAGAGRETLEILLALLTDKRLKLRVNMMIDSTKTDLLDEYYARGPLRSGGNGYLDIATIKILADGAMGSGGAALFESYHGDSGSKGWMLRETQEIQKLTDRALKAGFSVATHAIGDRACCNVLDAYQQALNANPEAEDPRLRIEHLQLVRDQDIARMAELGVVASVQPIHCTSDMEWVEGHLGSERCRALGYRWRDIVDLGVTLVAGSDTPIEDLSVIRGIHSAVTRQNSSGEPAGGWFGGQCLNVGEAITAYTSAAAFSCRHEHDRGLLVAGHLADIVVLSQDIHDCSAQDILSTEVVLTMVGGDVVFSR